MYFIFIIYYLEIKLLDIYNYIYIYIKKYEKLKDH